MLWLYQGKAVAARVEKGHSPVSELQLPLFKVIPNYLLVSVSVFSVSGQKTKKVSVLGIVK